MVITTNPNEPGLKQGVDNEPVPQSDVYLVLSEEERAKGFMRPLRTKYMHLGPPGPKNALRVLTDEEKARYAEYGYVRFEEYPPSDSSVTGRFWTQQQLDQANRVCGTITTMGTAIAETYARNPKFYGSTYCVSCQMHRPVEEFVWIDEKTGQTTGERVGS